MVFSSLTNLDILWPKSVDRGGRWSRSVGVAREGNERLVVEGILLDASLSILPKPLQLEGAAYWAGGEGGCTGKGGKSPGQHGAKLMITSVLSLASRFTVEQIQKRFRLLRSVVGGGGVEVELSGVTREWVGWRDAAEGKTAPPLQRRTPPLYPCPAPLHMLCCTSAQWKAENTICECSREYSLLRSW